MAFNLVSGTFGNILFIVSVIKTKKLRTIGNAFLISMAVSDLGVAAFVTVSAITGALYGRESFLQKPIPCHLIMSVAMVSCLVTIGSILLVSFHRFVIICFFCKRGKIFTRKSAGVMIAVTWVYGITCDLRYVMKWDNDGHGFDPKLEQCFYDRKADSWFLKSLSILTLVVITVSYSGIFRFVKRHRHAMWKSATKERQNSIRLAYTLLLVVVVFFICAMPYVIVTFIDKANLLPQGVYMFVMLLLFTGSATNWIIYGLTNQRFQDAFKRTLCLSKN
ncbi:melatonin receptor type 1C-like [Liolophura sinensis]|uniref:melatonin receptor type 1C-like n=1 Tax=Liolophura sinensis TaxID=3198878 RepID=UPI003158082A